MKIKENKYGRSKSCPSCGNALLFTRLSGMSTPHVFLYSSDSSEILVSSTLFTLFINSGSDEFIFVNILDEYLVAKGLSDKGFSLKNGLICPHCKSYLSNTTDSTVSTNLRAKAVYLDNMIYRTDSDVFQIKISALPRPNINEDPQP